MPKYVLPADVTDAGLKKLLSSLGLEVSSDERKALLAVSHKTRREKINKLLESAGEPGTAMTRDGEDSTEIAKVEEVSKEGETYKLGMVIDGWWSKKTYVVIAICAKGMMCVRKVQSDLYAVKFYDTFEACGFTRRQLQNDFGAQGQNRRTSGQFVYDRFCFTFKQLLQLFDQLQQMPEMNSLTPRQLIAIKPEYNTIFSIEQHEADQENNPDKPKVLDKPSSRASNPATL